MEFSISPDGERFPFPLGDDYQKEYKRLSIIARGEREKGREIVVFMGLGFVGAVMADAVDKETGEPGKFVIGMQRPSTRSFWKISLINRGVPPLKTEDPSEDFGDLKSGCAEMGAEIKVHDPYVAHWWEFENQDTYPAVGRSRSRFFRNQDHLKELRMCPKITEAL
jgi:hypothetical protein